MKLKNVLIVCVIIVASNLSLAQTNDGYRLRALKLFCQNKDELVIVDNHELGRQQPLFLIKLSGWEDSLFLKSEWKPDTTILKFYLNDLIKEYIVINDKNIDISQTFNISDFCDCIYQRIYKMECYDYIDSNLCTREYGLNISNVIPYKGSQYVVLQILSYFAERVATMQVIIMEFSNDGELLRCGKGYLLRS